MLKLYKWSLQDVSTQTTTATARSGRKKVIVEASGRDSWRQTVKRAANVKVRWKKTKSLLLMRRRTCDNIRTICNHFGMRVSIKIIFL